MVKQKSISRFAFWASFFALGVIALGAFTRLIDAGLGCPDWPGCYGHLTVSGAIDAGTSLVAYKAWAEMIHRYFVAGLSIFIAVIVGNIFFRRHVGKLNYVLAVLLILLLAYQIMLGQWTVTLKLLPIIVTQHLLGGFLILSTLWLVHLNNHTGLASVSLRRGWRCGLLLATVVAFLLVFLQICLGAWTSTNYASLSCPNFPFCSNHASLVWQWSAAFKMTTALGVNYDGGVLPEAVRQTIQMAHRVGALVVTVYLLLLMMIAMPKFIRLPELMKLFYVMFGLLCVQLCIGISNVLFKLPLVTAVSHTIVAALLLLTLLTLIFKLAIARGET